MQLTPTSYIVLGLLEWFGEATPYALKRMVAGSVGNFWTLHHAQLYSEPERLAKGGYVSVELERGGRRRKTYAITEAGREAVADWRAQTTDAIRRACSGPGGGPPAQAGRVRTRPRHHAGVRAGGSAPRA